MKEELIKLLSDTSDLLDGAGTTACEQMEWCCEASRIKNEAERLFVLLESQPSDQWIGLVEAAKNACSEWELLGDHKQDFMVKLRAELDKLEHHPLPPPPAK